MIGHVQVVGGHLNETSVALLAFLCSTIWEIRLYLFLVHYCTSARCTLMDCDVKLMRTKRRLDVLLPWFKT